MRSLEEQSRQLYEARRDHTAIPALTALAPSLSLTDGFAIQKLGLERDLFEGRRLCGYKMGLTSKAKQRDVNVHEPIRGYLLADMEVEKSGAVDCSCRIHPRAEPEVAVILKTALEGDVSLRQVREAISVILPAIEILDSRFEDFSFKLADVVADNTSASGFLLGANNLAESLNELPLLGITVKKNGLIVETGAPAAVLGDPLLSVVALARSLARENQRIEPGMIVLTGGITASVPFGEGDSLEVIWPGETLIFHAV